MYVTSSRGGMRCGRQVGGLGSAPVYAQPACFWAAWPGALESPLVATARIARYLAGCVGVAPGSYSSEALADSSGVAVRHRPTPNRTPHPPDRPESTLRGWQRADDDAEEPAGQGTELAVR